ncbi:MotA/TolQ/ExbB proton channel family protein [Teredinibacter sp. KSP-S5-2]|uniref:MotA/TolQ/ExbB proton channel family protein n=1 Tax=Teredinibacter sp. KSP-S5-2 TaxID=3034506 RepID=UPI00293517E4|nr:MotA/TolQ/ExbB proton channel family protein [Teredinibacter sp. KSP-S5-2]WNO10332.1 MotA/TolQ/ExbB proton channel family protein [Teredinibacter sp. KSP-S5-2]
MNGIRFLFLFFFSVFILADYSYSDGLSESIVDDIKKSQHKLEKQQSLITKKMGAMQDEIRLKERQLSALRQKAVEARKLSDEQTLGLDKLRNQVSQWRNQNIYQQHLLIGFAEDVDYPVSDVKSVEDNIMNGIDLLDQYISGAKSRLYPSWRATQVVIKNGEIRNVESIKIGPVSWYLDEDDHSAGILSEPREGLPETAYLFSSSEREELQRLYQEKRGLVVFDPSLDRALKVYGQKDSLLQHLSRGGLWAVPILIFAVLATTIALMKATYIVRLPRLLPNFVERVERIVKKDEETKRAELTLLLKSLKGAQSNILKIALQNPVSDKRDDKLFAFLLDNKYEMERFLGVIAVTASVAPLLGLLGTVSGMIDTFKMMTLFGSGDPAVVSGGISEALVTTELGLVVAIPALLINALLSRKIKNYSASLESNAIKLSKIKL